MDWTRELQMYVQVDGPVKTIDFLIGVLNRMQCNLYYRIYNKYPMLVISKPGRTNKSIFLSTRMDVATVVDPDKWTYPPFSGHYDENTDRIYGRGIQDSKSLGIQYLAVLHSLFYETLDFTIHLAFVTGDSLSDFYKTPSFRALDTQLILNSSNPSPFEHFLLSYAERTIWQFAIRIRSEPRHILNTGSGPTCETKLRILLNEVEKFRQRDHQLNVARRREFNVGYTNTIHMTGITTTPTNPDILSQELIVYFDMRVGLDTSLNALLDEIQRWTLVAGCGDGHGCVALEWIKCDRKNQQTDMRHAMSTKFLTFMQENKIPYALTISSDSTEVKDLRNEGLPVIGFTPINRTPPLVYTNDEFIYRQQFLDNIQLLTSLIKYLAIL